MALTTMGMAAALFVAGQANHSGSTTVAVVDVPAVSEQYAKTRDLEAEFERRRQKLNQERSALREKVERTGRSLQEELKPGTEEFQARRKQLAMYEAELQWFVDTAGETIERELAASLRLIYADIHDAVRQLAEEKKIDIVIAADRLPEENPQTTTQARQQIVLQKVLYWRPSVDLTADVIARLNATYKPPADSSGSGLAKPPSPEADEGTERPSIRD